MWVLWSGGGDGQESEAREKAMGGRIKLERRRWAKGARRSMDGREGGEAQHGRKEMGGVEEVRRAVHAAHAAL